MLVKCFKKEYGTTIMNALMEIRLQKAAERLKNGRQNLKEIASECGFSSPYYFSRCFSESEKVTPTSYRKQHSFI
jgi:AraC-like DNA-binding protein